MKMSWIKRIDINAKHIQTEDDFHDEIEGFADIDGYGTHMAGMHTCCYSHSFSFDVQKRQSSI